MCVEEDGKIVLQGDATVDRSGSGMLDGGWNFSWNDWGVSDEENAGFPKVESLVGLVDGIWSEFVFSNEENTWQKGDDAANFFKELEN